MNITDLLFALQVLHRNGADTIELGHVPGDGMISRTMPKFITLNAVCEEMDEEEGKVLMEMGWVKDEEYWTYYG